MTYPMKMGEAIAAIRSAFDPLHCIVRIYDHGKRARFHVYDPDHKHLYSAFGVPLVDYGSLRAQIEYARRNLQQQGWNFDPWTPPG